MRDSIIDELIYLFSRLPSLGPRSARRVVLHLFNHRFTLLPNLIDTLASVKEHALECAQCGNIDVTQPCSICSNPTRDHKTLIIVESIANLWALERSKAIKGVYFILSLEERGATQSDRSREENQYEKLKTRMADPNLTEVILALGSTLDGQTATHYVYELLKPFPVSVTRLAHGIPLGGELDYLDEGTITMAFTSRTKLSS